MDSNNLENEPLEDIVMIYQQLVEITNFLEKENKNVSEGVNNE